MFTGIIERKGEIAGVSPVPGGLCLRIDAGPIAAECPPGASVCVSGVCLTVEESSGTRLSFHVIPETLDRSTLGRKQSGDLVNLERSLRVGDRLDGHFVQGHVDGRATVARVQASAQEHVVWLEPDESLHPYLIPKGSVAIDGVSLTIAGMTGSLFSVALIPTTLERTTLSLLRRGDFVNVESDLVARAIVHRLGEMHTAGSLTFDTLREAGFA